MAAEDQKTGQPEQQYGRKQSLNLMQSKRNFGSGLKQYTYYVKMMRLILPLLALCLILLLILWPQFGAKQHFEDAVSVEQRPALKKDAHTNRLVAARYENKDSQGRPYIIEADEAAQREEDAAMIDLIFPKATLFLNDESKIHIKSSNGLYQQKDQSLMLGGQVFISHSLGYVLKAMSLQGDLRSRTAYTSDPVMIEGPDILLDASGMRVDNNGNRITFTGPATFQYTPPKDN
jgi:lipopolysaccharide export system protein LptC